MIFITNYFIYIIYKMNKKIDLSKDNYFYQQSQELQESNNNSNINNKNIIAQNVTNKELQQKLLDMNSSLRTDIKLSLAIFKQKNNFDYNYINNNV